LLGFGNFASVSVASDKLEQLQENLIKSHAAGCGPPLSPERTRMLLALRVNVLAKGYRLGNRFPSFERASSVRGEITNSVLTLFFYI
jgi:hypothetical protein